MTTTKKKADSNSNHVNRIPQPGIKKVHVTIRGLSPLIFQGKGLMEADGEESGKKKKSRPPEEEAKLRAHWTGKGENRVLCIPWVMLYQSICSSAKSFKFRGQRTMGTVVAATITCTEDKISLGTAEFETLEEYVKIPPRTGAMVKIGRPLIREWEVSFTMIVDDELYDANVLHEIIRHAGKLIGIGAWRPELKGPHGRFEVTAFEVE